MKSFYLLIGIATGMVGYHIHHSIFWAIFDGLFWEIAWIKWLICQQVTLSIIKATFAFFFT